MYVYVYDSGFFEAPGRLFGLLPSGYQLSTPNSQLPSYQTPSSPSAFQIIFNCHFCGIAGDGVSFLGLSKA